MSTDIRMTRARSALVMAHAFFGSLALRLVIVERHDVETLATDGKFLFYCRKFLDAISEEVLLFGVAHEVLHCALGHHTRRNGRDANRWNIACDYVVNAMLKQAGFKVPVWAFLDSAYTGLNAEEIYRILENKERQEQPPPPKEEEPEPPADLEDEDEGPGASGPAPDEGQEGGDPAPEGGDDSSSPPEGEGTEGPTAPTEATSASDGSGGSQPLPPDETAPVDHAPAYAPANGDPGRCGEILDAAPDYDVAAKAEAAEEWQVFTRQAANIARRAGEGKLPGFIEEVVETLNDPRTDWRNTLRRFVDPSSATKDYSWSKPNRRMMGMGYYTPGLTSDGINHVAIAIDTSASVDYTWLQKFGCEAQAALDDGAIDKVTVIFADTSVTNTAEYNKGETIDFTVQGRGGTAFAPTLEWVNENAPDVAALVYFTDLDCTDFGAMPSYPVLWAAYGEDPRTVNSYMARVPFGECVELQ